MSADEPPEFKNPATRERRAWIDRALASARAALAADESPRPAVPIVGTGTPADESSPAASRPKLGIVPTPGRSG